VDEAREAQNVQKGDTMTEQTKKTMLAWEPAQLVALLEAWEKMNDQLRDQLREAQKALKPQNTWRNN
jgi:16S rRNA G1207 methylase RsmC